MITYHESDINLAFAISAYNGISFSPERRGQAHVTEYMRHMAAVAAEFSEYATDENCDEIANALNEYRAGYLKRLNAMLVAKSRCVSSFITGPSNFPVARARKANEVEHNRAGEFYEYQDWKLEQLRRRFDPRRLAHAPIRLDDDDAVEKLEKKLAKSRRNHEGMKAANKILASKKHSDDEKVERLMNEVGYTELTARAALLPDVMGVVGFAPWSLSNNLANIKRLEGRLAQVLRERSREQPDEYNAPAGVKVIENTEEVRIQLIFDGKPPEVIRTILKKNGFRWSPTQGAWQRLLNANGRAAAKYVLAQIARIENAVPFS